MALINYFPKGPGGLVKLFKSQWHFKVFCEAVCLVGCRSLSDNRESKFGWAVYAAKLFWY